MHQVLLIREILLKIFGYCSPTLSLESLAVLARTCRAFKEPALDVLWETLFDLSPLARCLPEACKIDELCHSFSRPLSDAEWNTLRGYTRHVKSIQKFPDICDTKIVVLPQVPFTEPLFPNLRSLLWGHFRTLPVKHIAVPSLTSLSLSCFIVSEPVLTDSLDTIGERCPNIRQFTVFVFRSGPLDAAISRQLCRWSNLQYVDCRGVTLTMDVVLHLPSLSTLKLLWFTLSADLGNCTTHLGSVPVFILSSLVNLEIRSTSLKSVTTFFSHIQSPTIKDLDVAVSEYTPQRDVREYWTTVQRACPFNTLARLAFSSIETLLGLDEQRRPCLTLHDLPYRDFGNLRKIEINVAWSVNLTDADILDLVSASPQLEELYINNRWGWRMSGEGGITLGGLMQLMRQCPSLYNACFAINAPTFTPRGLDMSFPPRRTYPGPLTLNCLDSRGFGSDCESVFKALGLSVWHGVGSFPGRIWDRALLPPAYSI